MTAQQPRVRAYIRRLARCGAANTVAVQSACILFLTVYAALSFLPYNNLEPGAVYGIVMGVVLLLLNVGFLVCQLIQVTDWSSMRQAGKKLSRRLSKTFSWGVVGDMLSKALSGQLSGGVGGVIFVL